MAVNVKYQSDPGFSRRLNAIDRQTAIRDDVFSDISSIARGANAIASRIESEYQGIQHRYVGRDGLIPDAPSLSESTRFTNQYETSPKQEWLAIRAASQAKDINNQLGNARSITSSDLSMQDQVNKLKDLRIKAIKSQQELLDINGSFHK